MWHLAAQYDRWTYLTALLLVVHLGGVHFLSVRVGVCASCSPALSIARKLYGSGGSYLPTSLVGKFQRAVIKASCTNARLPRLYLLRCWQRGSLCRLASPSIRRAKDRH